jgi:probable rRNA maturation factor
MTLRFRVERGPHAGLERARIKRRAEAMLALLQLEDSELSLVLSDDDQIHELNRVYRGKDKPTDVLAFPMREGDFGRLHSQLPAGLLGDVIVSVPTASRQAKAAKRPALDEITMLVAHGLLHLLGWDHDTAAKDRAMRAETDRLVAAAVAVEERGVKRVARAKSAVKSGAKRAAKKTQKRASSRIQSKLR